MVHGLLDTKINQLLQTCHSLLRQISKNDQTSVLLVVFFFFVNKIVYTKGKYKETTFSIP